MRQELMRPVHYLKNKTLPIGVFVVFGDDDDDADAFHHLVSFLRSHFNFHDNDFTNGIVDPEDDRFPFCWVDNDEVTLPVLLRKSSGINCLPGEVVRIGFSHSHLPLFRAYKKYLEDDPACEFDETRSFFSDVEQRHFGSHANLN